MGKLFSDVRGVINPALIILLLLAVMIPVTIVATKQRQNLQQNAATCRENGCSCIINNDCDSGICQDYVNIGKLCSSAFYTCNYQGFTCNNGPVNFISQQDCGVHAGNANCFTTQDACQQSCEQQPTPAENGATCTNDSDCRSGICQQYSSGKFCSSAFYSCGTETATDGSNNIFKCEEPSNYTSLEDCQKNFNGTCFFTQAYCQQKCEQSTATPTPTPSGGRCPVDGGGCTSDVACRAGGTGCENYYCVPSDSSHLYGSYCSPNRPQATSTPGGGGGYSTPTPGGGGGNPTPTPGGAGNQCDTPGAPVASCNTSCPLANDPSTCGGHTYCVYQPGGNQVGPCQCETAQQTCLATGGGGATPTPTPHTGNPSCELLSSCNGATCTFTNNFYIDGVKQTNYISTLQPNTADSATVTGWCTNRTFSHTYSSVSEGPYTAELNVGFGSISTDSNNDGCQDSGNPPNLQWQYSCRTTVLGTPPRCKSGLIEGNVFVDTNRNGHKDSGEINYRGATLKLSGVQEEVEISNGDGNYQFDDLPEGQYYVTVDVDNYDPTTTDPASPNIDSCADQDTVNFGIAQHQQQPSNTPTPPVTVTPSLTPTPGTGDTIFAFSQLRMQALGSAEGGNPNPQHQQRQLQVQALNSNNQIVSEKTGTVIFSLSTGTFAGTVNMGNGITSGNYTIKVKTDRYLRKLLPGIIRVNAETTNQMPDSTTTLLTGDINGDNKLDITDYNTLLGCYNISPVSVNCVNSDLDDNGVIDGIDYNYFVRNLNNQTGN